MTETAAPPRCRSCLDEGHVCEDHPGFPWEGIWGSVEGHAEHGGIGMPCTECCGPVIADGATSITEAFVPRWKREKIEDVTEGAGRFELVTHPASTAGGTP